MKTIICLLISVLSLPLTGLGQNIGIGTTTPQSRLDINGDIAFRSADITIGSTYNYALDVNTVKQSNYKLKSQAIPVGNFIIAGITAAVDGRTITLTNRSDFSMELYNEDVTSLAANRITTGTGTTFAVYNGGSVSLQYDANVQRWEIISSYYNSLDYFGGGGGGSNWDINGPNIYNSNIGNVGIGTSTPDRAKLEVAGVSGIGYTSAIFGGDGNGISIQRNWPSIGFNQYRDGPAGIGKAISSGYGMNMNLNPTSGFFSLDMLDSTVTNNSFSVARRSLNIYKNGNVHIGANDISDAATLSVSGSTNYPSHFNYGTDGHTYIRGGNKLYGGPGIFASRRPSKVYINDLPGAQWSTNNPVNGGDVIIALGGGKTGIGLDAPSNKLSIFDNTINLSGNTELLQVAGVNPMISLATQNIQSFAYIKGISDLTNTPQFARTGLEIGAGGLDIYLTSAGYQPALMVNGTNNFIGIGTNNPSQRLSVNGSIRSKEIIVEASPWADYVFEEKYELPSLDSIAQYIKQYKHLPGIPAASEIETVGLKVGEMQTKMMEKIEELTLYVIELKKEIEILRNQQSPSKMKK